jgi:hypothetical protein
VSSMAESGNKKLLSALTEGHEKELRSSARIGKTSIPVPSSSSTSSSVKSGSNTKSLSKTQKVVVSGAQAAKCKSQSLLGVECNL